VGLYGRGNKTSAGHWGKRAEPSEGKEEKTDEKDYQSKSPSQYVSNSETGPRDEVTKANNTGTEEDLNKGTFGVEASKNGAHRRSSYLDQQPTGIRLENSREGK